MKNNISKIIISQLKSGGSFICNKRDYLIISQYAESIGMKIQIVNKKGMMLNIKAK